MGAIHLEPLSALALTLQRASDARSFVETGTYLGYSLPWASEHFENVFTIEISPEYQAKAKESVEGIANIHFVLGNSADHLQSVCDSLHHPAVFWLDAHAGAGYFGEHENCPLLTELQTVLAGDQQHIIFVDDARAFTSAPPPPFDYRNWPSLEEIFSVVLAHGDYHVSIISDAIIIVPANMRSLVADYSCAVRPTI